LKKIILSLFALTLILMASCSNNATDAIDEVNKTMNLPFILALSEKDLEYGDEYERANGFGGYTLRKDGLMFWVSGWPDVVDDYHVTEYRFTDDKYTVFNISVGNTLNDAVSIMEKNGYSRDKEEESFHGNSMYIFQKNEQVRISLQVNGDDQIAEIWVTAIATNKDNVVF